MAEQNGTGMALACPMAGAVPSTARAMNLPPLARELSSAAGAAGLPLLAGAVPPTASALCLPSLSRLLP